MSMIGRLRRVTKEELAQIGANPDKAYELILSRSVHVDTKKQAIADGRRLMEQMRDMQERYAKTGLFDRLRQANLRRERASPEDLAAHAAYLQEYQELATNSGSVPEAPGAELSLDKSWHALHFLLTGKSQGVNPPYSLAVLGGKPVPDRHDVMSYGPALKLSQEEVASVADALAKLSPQELMKRYDAAAMRKHKIYAAGEDAEQDTEYLGDYYEKLRAHYALAASEQSGMLFSIR